MNNYEYIVSSLPAISLDWKFGDGMTFGTYIDWIKSQLSPSDIRKLDTLLEGYDDSRLCREFYEAALKDSDPFLREFFTFDLNVRNAKARFLNRAFSRPEDQDTIDLQTGEFPERAALDEVLSKEDLLERERGLDALVWNKISELTLFNYFDLDSVLGFVARLHIIGRWASLDEETGRDMFKRLVDEVRETFEGVKYNPSTE